MLVTRASSLCRAAGILPAFPLPTGSKPVGQHSQDGCVTLNGVDSAKPVCHMLTSLITHKELLVWLSIVSGITFFGSLLLIPFLVVRMGADYFMPHRDEERTFAGRHPVIRWTGLILKNVIGALLILAGIAMLVLPGQGLLTIVMGIMMLNFPGKRAFERRLVRLPGVLRAINHLRARAHREPLQLPEKA